MFKKSRRRIVSAIMAVLFCLFVGTLAVIYAASYTEVSNSNHEMLQRHAQMYVLTDFADSPPAGNIPPVFAEPLPGDVHGRKPFENSPSFQLSTFYSVAVSEDGRILATDIGDREVYDSQTLEEYAEDILSGSRIRGKKGSLVFHVEEKTGYTLVAFMDNTVIHESMSTLFRYTLLFGSIALAALFFLAVYLARRIVQPLEESYRKQQQFISDAGHELKTPVSVVGANAEMLSREIGDNQWLSNIQYENERMGTLVCQLLELTRTESTVPSTEVVDFSRLVKGGVLPFESVAFEKGMSITTEIHNEIYIKGNAGQLSQLVSILTDNAIQHGSSGKEIFISLSETRSGIVLSVVNDGAPIPPENIEHLFERFYRADKARSSDSGHYGLGLSIAKAIVNAHHGNIDVVCSQGKVCFSARFSKLNNKV